MTKNEFKSHRTKINRKMDQLLVEIKATHSAIDRGMGTTDMIMTKYKELKILIKELENASH